MKKRVPTKLTDHGAWAGRKTKIIGPPISPVCLSLGATRDSIDAAIAKEKTDSADRLLTLNAIRSLVVSAGKSSGCLNFTTTT